MIDLHTHTTASDGTLTPPELVAHAAAARLLTLAITDHDTTDAIAPAAAAAEAHGITLIAGVELGTEDERGEHDILGYFVDVADPPFQSLLETIRAHRHVRAVAIVERLRAAGAPLAIDDVLALSDGGAIGRPHVARALVAIGWAEDVSDAFNRFLGTGRPAHVGRYRLSPAEACAAIRAAGGVPVLAHPTPPGNPWSDPKRLRTMLGPLADAGLGGLECYYTGYTARVNRWLAVLADHFGLVPSGGSDFHGPHRPRSVLGAVRVPEDTVERLRAAAGPVPGDRPRARQ
ncbi:MAG: PHP domain-containing protein [Ardenticatenales bacterium]|jgi:predicted metal-dependent phosphoesterase TrpH|nr:PHP domain-containing protein [Ardenticatenales bacterium]